MEPSSSSSLTILDMIDALEKFVIKNKIGYIRIDGRVHAEKRH